MKNRAFLILSTCLIFSLSVLLRAEERKTDFTKLAAIMDRYAAEYRRQAEFFSTDAKQATASVAGQLQSLVQSLNDGASVREQIAKAARANDQAAVDSLYNLITPSMEKIKQLKESLRATGYVEKMKLEKKAMKSKDPSSGQDKIPEIHITTPQQLDDWMTQSSSSGKSLK